MNSNKYQQNNQRIYKKNKIKLIKRLNLQNKSIKDKRNFKRKNNKTKNNKRFRHSKQLNQIMNKIT